MTSPGTGDPATTPPGAPIGTPPPADAAPTPPHAVPAASARPAGGAGSSVGNVLSGEWPVQAADAIVQGVDTLRDKTTGPAQKAARGVVYGLLAAVLGTMVAILLVVGFVRLVDSLVGLFMDPPRIWLTYLIVGVVFTSAGALVFRRRRADVL
jgi:hypothetical protein